MTNRAVERGREIQILKFESRNCVCVGGETLMGGWLDDGGEGKVEGKAESLYD